MVEDVPLEAISSSIDVQFLTRDELFHMANCLRSEGFEVRLS